MGVSKARAAAFDVLLRIGREKAFSSILLPVYEARLSSADRGLCHELVLGVLRRQFFLDRVISDLTRDRRLDLEVLIALRLGLYQLICLDRIPEYSAVNESVALAGRKGKTSAKGLVNTTLRRFLREKPSISIEDPIERLSVDSSHPRWLIEKWVKDLGSDETARLANANNQTPPIAFRVTAKVRDSFPPDRYRVSENVDGCYLATTMTEELLTMAENSEIYFQDEGSQLVATAVSIAADGTFLDVCAAPGGKTTAIANNYIGLGINRRPMIVAGDLNWRRVKFLHENCSRQGVGFVQVLQFDAEADPPFAERSFDSVLVDAPCSGTGTIRHNPEIRYFIESGDFDELKRTQLAILANVSKLVRSGGELIYSTCSLEREENEEVCWEFGDRSPDFRLAKPDLPSKFHTPEGFVRTWPQRDDMDGFFIARFVKNS